MYEMKFGRLVFPMWNHSFCAGQCASWILKGLNRGRMVDTQKDHLFDGRVGEVADAIEDLLGDWPDQL